MNYEDLILKGDFIPTDDKLNTNYLWDDYQKCNELIKENENLSVYTVIDEDDKLWILEGFHLVNRVGYLFSRKHVELEGDVEY